MNYSRGYFSDTDVKFIVICAFIYNLVISENQRRKLNVWGGKKNVNPVKIYTFMMSYILIVRLLNA